MFDGFAEDRVPAGDIDLLVRHRNAGPDAPVVLLLHGHPRTSATWHRVAPALFEAGFTVVCPDLPGYGRSGKPEPTADHRAHSKRAAATRIAAAMSVLGHPRFGVAGHDRGGPVALRLTLDFPERVTRAAFLDCLPISEHLQRLTLTFVTRWYHWFFFAQPDIPERVINADPAAWYGGDPQVMGQQNFDEFRAAIADPATVRGMLEDYRAGLGVDRLDEQADVDAGRQLRCPTLVLWSTRDDLELVHGDPLAIWRNWTDDLSGFAVESGHHMAEEAPGPLGDALEAFFGGSR